MLRKLARVAKISLRSHGFGDYQMGVDVFGSAAARPEMAPRAAGCNCGLGAAVYRDVDSAMVARPPIVHAVSSCYIDPVSDAGRSKNEIKLPRGGGWSLAICIVRGYVQAARRQFVWPWICSAPVGVLGPYELESNGRQPIKYVLITGLPNRSFHARRDHTKC